MEKNNVIERIDLIEFKSLILPIDLDNEKKMSIFSITPGDSRAARACIKALGTFEMYTYNYPLEEYSVCFSEI